jgi:hypothetical protein
LKKATTVNKLAALLGITEDVVAKSVHVKNDPQVQKELKRKASSRIGISEDEIQDFRAAQGIVYFLQAPELFSPKVCPHCGESFLVSRQFVAFCSYTCIAKDLESKGLKWEKGKDIEALVTSVYEGNEPIWIKNIDRLREALDSGNFKESLLSRINTHPMERSTEQAPTSSAVLQTT